MEQGREREKEVGRRKGGKRRQRLRERRNEGNTGERDKHWGDLKIRDLLLILSLALGVLSKSLSLSGVGLV